jgi:NAD+ diphosphatase
MTSIPFSGNPLDRASDRRVDPKWVGARRRDPDSLVWPFSQLKPLLVGSGDTVPVGADVGYVRCALANEFVREEALCIFLGLDKGRALFAQDVGASDSERLLALKDGSYFCDARSAAQLLPPQEAAILGQAKALIDWHQRHGFCPNCGAPTVFVDAGYRRHCAGCGANHFPRTDPVVIMLAICEDACLVGRAKRFPEGMFSALAGFIEPGETIEEAVAREILEEAGVRVRNVRYYAAQPWPFPSSLMIGCFADAETREINVDQTELAEARWVTRAQVCAVLGSEHTEGLKLPPPVAIAHHLLKHFAEGGA